MMNTNNNLSIRKNGTDDYEINTNPGMQDLANIIKIKEQKSAGQSI